MTPVTIIPVPGTRQDYQFGFVPTMSGRVAIELDIAQPNGAVWIDNVNLQQATITPTNPDDYIVFQYNPSKTTKTFTLTDTYLDAKGTTYTGTVTLQPYTSLVLFKQSLQNATSAVAAPQTIALKGNLVNANAASMVSSTATKLNWQVENQNSTASRYEVERSTDAVTFTSVGVATVKKSATSVSYEYNDMAPSNGKNYYRIKQVDEKGAYAISKMIMIKNIGFSINPNPARDIAHVMFGQMVSSSDHLDKEIVIRNAAGVIVKTIAMPSTDNLSRVDVNVSSLSNGMYTLSITSEGQTFSKAFIKE